MAPTPDFQAVCPFCFELILESSSLVDLFSGVFFFTSFVLHVNLILILSSMVYVFVFLCSIRRDLKFLLRLSYLPTRPSTHGEIISSLSDSDPNWIKLIFINPLISKTKTTREFPGNPQKKGGLGKHTTLPDIYPSKGDTRHSSNLKHQLTSHETRGTKRDAKMPSPLERKPLTTFLALQAL